MAEQSNLSSTEKIKQASDSLRGTLKESVENDISGNLYADDVALVRFHGMYVQDDRDRRDERAEKKLERLYSFMIRLRLPGGFLPPQQWIDLNNIAGENSTGVLKITTRQTIQLHGVYKSRLKPTLKAFNEAKLTTIATCGDINRNVLCSSHPKQSALHEEIYGIAKEINQMMLPKTHGYYEIWLDHEKIADKKLEEDPLYQDRYKPRKFNIGIGIQPNNDIDVFANDLGLIAIEEEIEKRAGFPLEKERPFKFTRRQDYYGWEQNHEGKWFYTLYVENGRVLDTDDLQIKSALIEAAKTGKTDFILTCNQNVILGNIKNEDKETINEILSRYRLLEHTDNASVVRKNSIACVALNTCPLALAESQRYMPSLLSKIEPMLATYGLQNEEIIVRMTGCPNGCARPNAAELAFIGTSLGHYNLHIGGDRLGTRLNHLYKESLDEAGILTELDGLFATFSSERKKGETFGDFTYRKYFNGKAN